MTHVGKQVLDAFKSALTGLPLTGANVFSGRIYNLKTDTELPSICLYAPSSTIEDIQPGRIQPGLQRRNIITHVVVVVKAVNLQVYDDLYEIAQQVEDKIFQDPTLGGLSENTSIISESKTIEEVDGVIGFMNMIFSSIVITKQQDSGKSIQQ